jgi:hypothetical protein
MLASMYWILAALFLLVTLTVPRLRPFAVVGCVILGGMLTWAVIQRVRDTDPGQLQERGRPTTPAALVRSIPLEQVELNDAKLTGGGAPFKFTGRVANHSSTLQLKSLMLDISRRDCHASALEPSGCAPGWRGRHWVELSVPPNQERQFAVSIWARGDAPRSLGTVHDEFEIVAANGELAHAK